MNTKDSADERYTTQKVEDGYTLSVDGRAVAFLRGEDGALRAELIPGVKVADDKQKCFEDCFAKSDGSLGASKKCSQKCGLE